MPKLYQRICPICNDTYTQMQIVSIDQSLYKIYKHPGGGKCKMAISDEIIYRTEEPLEYCEVDVHEQDADMHNKMAHFVKKVKIASLSSGDIAIPEYKIGIERKFISDCDGSMQDDSLEDQIERGSKEYDMFIVIISGSLTIYAHQQSERGERDPITIIKQINSFKANLMLKTFTRYPNVRIKSVENDFQLAHFVARFGYFVKELKDKGMRVFIKKPELDKMMPVSYNQLRCHSGVGDVKAMKFLDSFGNYKSFVNASTDDKINVGFSEKFIKNIEDEIEDIW